MSSRSSIEDETPPGGSTVLACIDASVYADSVCDHAAWAAQRMPAAVRLLHVLDRRERGGAPHDLSGSIGLGANEALLEELTRLDEHHSRLAQARGRLLLDAATRRITEAGVTDVSALRRHGSFLETVVEMEAEADVVVIGKRGEAADFAKPHLGSNLERVVRASIRPVLVAARAFRPIETVLIAFDGSPSARKAIERVRVRRAFQGLRLHVLMAGSDTAEHRRQLDWARATLADHGEAAECSLLPGNPEKVIADAVRERDAHLLVMGAYGHSRIREFIVGSTTTALVRTCQVPVLLYR